MDLTTANTIIDRLDAEIARLDDVIGTYEGDGTDDALDAVWAARDNVHHARDEVDEAIRDGRIA